MLKFNGKHLGVSASRGIEIARHDGDSDAVGTLEGSESTVLCAEIRTMLQKHHEQLTERMQGWVDAQNKLVASLVERKHSSEYDAAPELSNMYEQNLVDCPPFLGNRICDVLARHEIILDNFQKEQRLLGIGGGVKHKHNKNGQCNHAHKLQERKSRKLDIANTLSHRVVSAVNSFNKTFSTRENRSAFTMTFDAEDSKRRTRAEGVAEIVETSKRLQRLELSGSYLSGPNLCFAISNSWRFELVFAVAIITNSIFVGIQVDYAALHPGEDPPIFFYIIQHCYAFLFLVELVIRIFADDWRGFLCSEQWYWNLLDVFIVATSLFEVVMDIIHLSDDGDEPEGMAQNTSNMRIVRIIRITRLIRVFRIIRVIRFVHALRTLVYSIVCTMKSLVWAMLLLVMIIYVFGILFTEATTYHFQLLDGFDQLVNNEDTREFLLHRYWGTLPRSMFTLFKAISGGISWDIVVFPLAEINWVWVGVFTIFIAFAYFAVLNVVTGVFCQSAIETAQQNEDLVIQTQIANKKVYVDRIKRLFKDMDIDQSGDITIREFEKHLGSDSVQAYFASLDLDTSDAWTLFKLLDSDEGNAIDVEEFIMGCLRLKGTAKSIDIAKMSCENKFMMKKLGTFMKFVELELESVAEVLHEITCDNVDCEGAGRPVGHMMSNSSVASASVGTGSRRLGSRSQSSLLQGRASRDPKNVHPRHSPSWGEASFGEANSAVVTDSSTATLFGRSAHAHEHKHDHKHDHKDELTRIAGHWDHLPPLSSEVSQSVLNSEQPQSIAKSEASKSSVVNFRIDPTSSSE